MYDVGPEMSKLAINKADGVLNVPFCQRFA